MSHSLFKQLCTAHHDRTAFSYLSDVELKQDPKDHRPFEVVFVCLFSFRVQHEALMPRSTSERTLISAIRPYRSITHCLKAYHLHPRMVQSRSR